MILTEEEKYMREAIRQAKKAYRLGEVPIGCVIVHQNKIIGRGYNRRNTDKSPLAHAEITAIARASKKIGDWRLEDCTMYVTLEPCQMCAGAIVQARIPQVVIGCMNPKAGCAGSVLNILEMPRFNHRVNVIRGFMEAECNALLTSFFKELREKNRIAKKERIQTARYLRPLTLEETAKVHKRWLYKHFPPEEIKPIKHIRRMWEEKAYTAFGFFQEERLLAYAFFAMADDCDLLLLDYFAVIGENRGKGIGGLFLQLLREQFPRYKGFLIETESAENAEAGTDRGMRLRRNAFYEKNGAKRTGFQTHIYGVTYSIWQLPFSDALPEKKCLQDLQRIYRCMVTPDKYREFIRIPF